MNTKRKAHVIRVVIKDNHIVWLIATDAVKEEMTNVVKVATAHADRSITGRQSFVEKPAEAPPC